MRPSCLPYARPAYTIDFKREGDFTREGASGIAGIASRTAEGVRTIQPRGCHLHVFSLQCAECGGDFFARAVFSGAAVREQGQAAEAISEKPSRAAGVAISAGTSFR